MFALVSPAPSTAAAASSVLGGALRRVLTSSEGASNVLWKTMDVEAFVAVLNPPPAPVDADPKGKGAENVAGEVGEGRPTWCLTLVFVVAGWPLSHSLQMRWTSY